MTIKSKFIAGTMAATLAVAAPTISQWEGVRTTPYRDIGGVWTVCHGETQGIDIHREYTRKECDQLFAESLPTYYDIVDKAVTREIPITMRASLVSFVYNVGGTNFRRSTLLRKVNRGDLLGACKELDKWSYVGKMWVKGLNNRRKAEYALCTAQLPKEA